MTSTRLPGKVAKELPYGSGITVLEQVARRLGRCRAVDQVIVAATTDKADAPLGRLAAKAGAQFFRGSKEDVLERYYKAALKFKLDTVVRITSDCPCVDPALVDDLVAVHRQAGADYTANVVRLTFPDGFDAEVFSFAALKAAHEQARDKADREHVTSYLRSHAELFKVVSAEAPAGSRRPDLRVTLDTAEDYLLLCAVYDNLYAPGRPFGLGEVLRLFAAKPWLEEINRRSLAKKKFASRREEFRRAVELLELQELGQAAAALKKLIKK